MKENIISTMLKALENDYFGYNTKVSYLGNSTWQIKQYDKAQTIDDYGLIEIFENYPPDMQQELLDTYGD